jgi:hypothetical protein
MTTINIKNQELVRKIKEAADRRNLGVTATLNEILDKDLAETERISEDDPVIQRVMKIVRRNRELVERPIRSNEVGDYLYDEDGMPS